MPSNFDLGSIVWIAMAVSPKCLTKYTPTIASASPLWFHQLGDLHELTAALKATGWTGYLQLLNPLVEAGGCLMTTFQ